MHWDKYTKKDFILLVAICILTEIGYNALWHMTYDLKVFFRREWWLFGNNGKLHIVR